jgi:excisionase family DNA binding protein
MRSKTKRVEPAPMYTPEEASIYARCTRVTIFHLLKSGEAPRVKVGRRTFIPKQAIDKMLGMEVVS